MRLFSLSLKSLWTFQNPLTIIQPNRLIPFPSWRLLSSIPIAHLPASRYETPPASIPKNTDVLIQHICTLKLCYLPVEWPWESDIASYRVGGLVIPIFLKQLQGILQRAHSNIDTKVPIVPDIGLEWTSPLGYYRDCMGEAYSTLYHKVVWSTINCHRVLFVSLYSALRVSCVGSEGNLLLTVQRQQLPSIWPSLLLEDKLFNWQDPFCHTVFLKSFTLSRYLSTNVFFLAIPSGFIVMSGNHLCGWQVL